MRDSDRSKLRRKLKPEDWKKFNVREMLPKLNDRESLPKRRQDVKLRLLPSRSDRLRYRNNKRKSKSAKSRLVWRSFARNKPRNRPVKNKHVKNSSMPKNRHARSRSVKSKLVKNKPVKSKLARSQPVKSQPVRSKKGLTKRESPSNKYWRATSPNLTPLLKSKFNNLM